MKSKTPLFVHGEILDRMLAGEPLEITIECQCRAPVSALIYTPKKRSDRRKIMAKNAELDAQRKKDVGGKVMPMDKYQEVVRKKYTNILRDQIRSAGQQLIDRADEMVPDNLSYVTGFSISIDIPQPSEEPVSISWTTETIDTNIFKEEK